jgi:hypothetical protein
MAYVAGHAASSDFPVTAGAYQTTFGNASNGAAFVAKLNLTASGVASLICSTFVGGTAYSGGTRVAVDALGNAYVTGTAQGNFPVTGGPFPGLSSGNGFIAEANAAGNRLVYSSLFAGGTAIGTAIAADSLGNAYLTGYLDSRGGNTIQTTADAFQPNCAAPANGSSGFVMKIGSTGTLIYSSYRVMESVTPKQKLSSVSLFSRRSLISTWGKSRAS